jgi:hypothetical protein
MERQANQERCLVAWGEVLPLDASREKGSGTGEEGVGAEVVCRSLDERGAQGEKELARNGSVKDCVVVLRGRICSSVLAAKRAECLSKGREGGISMLV